MWRHIWYKYDVTFGVSTDISLPISRPFGLQLTRTLTSFLHHLDYVKLCLYIRELHKHNKNYGRKVNKRVVCLGCHPGCRLSVELEWVWHLTVTKRQPVTGSIMNSENMIGTSYELSCRKIISFSHSVTLQPLESNEKVQTHKIATGYNSFKY